MEQNGELEVAQVFKLSQSAPSGHSSTPPKPSQLVSPNYMSLWGVSILIFPPKSHMRSDTSPLTVLDASQASQFCTLSGDTEEASDTAGQDQWLKYQLSEHLIVWPRVWKPQKSDCSNPSLVPLVRQEETFQARGAKPHRELFIGENLLEELLLIIHKKQ